MPAEHSAQHLHGICRPTRSFLGSRVVDLSDVASSQLGERLVCDWVKKARRLNRTLFGGPCGLHHGEVIGASARLQRKTVLGTTLVLDVVAKRLLKRQAVVSLERSMAGSFGSQSCVLCFRPIDARSRQRTDPRGFGTGIGQLNLTGAFTVLVCQSTLALSVLAFDRVAHQQSSRSVRSDAKLKTSVESNLVRLRTRSTSLYGANGKFGHWCPTGVR